MRNLNGMRIINHPFLKMIGGCFLLSINSFLIEAQTNLTIKVVDSHRKESIEGVSVTFNESVTKQTNTNGLVDFQLKTSRAHFHFTATGFNTLDTFINAIVDTLRIQLTEDEKQLQEVTIVSSTRNNQSIENAPLKIEVLGREEMDEESTIKPAGIGSILGDISGIQIQQSSSVSGNANVRIQGLDGRYTQLLKDGLPLYDGFSGGFGILSIPPLDLRQIELIKGSASTLYGGGAIGGLINILSRKPSQKQEAVLSLNQTTLKETNLNTFISRRYKYVGYTFFGGLNYQKPVDVNKDGFSDVTYLNGVIIHPKLFFYPGRKTTITTGYTRTAEKRNGGDMNVLSGHSNLLHQFFEKNTIHRDSWDFSMQHLLSNNKKLEFKSCVSNFKRSIANNEISFSGKQLNYYSELSILIPYEGNSLVAGINLTGDLFKKITNTIPLNNFHNNTIGTFIQNTWVANKKTTIEVGLRNDYHFTYGNFILPRIALFHRLNAKWATRVGVGLGYKTPNALAPQTTDIPIQYIQSISNLVKAEKSIGYNAEVNYKKTWGKGNEVFINHAFFLTQISNPITAYPNLGGSSNFLNQHLPVISKGFDTYIRTIIEGWEIYIGYTYTIAERKYLLDKQFIPLTPKNRFAFTVVKELEDAGVRIGIEGSYTGPQHREDYSYTPGYFFMAAMVEKKIGKHFTVVLNGENLLDYRQSKIEPLFTGSITNPLFKSLWGPIDGRIINMSLRWKL